MFILTLFMGPMGLKEEGSELTCPGSTDTYIPGSQAQVPRTGRSYFPSLEAGTPRNVLQSEAGHKGEQNRIFRVPDHSKGQGEP